MSRIHLQSFLFAAVLLVSVFATTPRADVSPQRTLAEEIQVTSVAAPERTAAAPEPAPAPTAIPQSTVPISNSQLLITVPITANVILAQDTASGNVLFARASDERWPLASLTKLMTATLAAEAWPDDRAIAITESAVKAEGNAGAFRPGELFSARDLITAMLVASSNDAAEAIAESYGRAAFIDAMQVRSAELGMRDTSFFDPTGLSVLNQGTARDLERLVTYVADAHPDFFAMTAERTERIRELRSGAERTLTNTNQFAGTPGFRGGKTGYTDEAGGNLISFFERNGRQLIIIVLGSEDRFGETERIYGALAGS